MDQFRTQIEIPKSDFKISYHSKILMLGSCFVENIGSILNKNKFNISVNPFGIVYNPFSVANCIKFLIENKIFTEENLNFANNLYFSYYHHGSFSNNKLEDCLENINSKRQSASLDLAGADILCITFGTSWVYELIDSGLVVSNCHKQLASSFHRYRLNVDEIVKLYKELILSLSLFNPHLKIIFTISPIRHWKDGANGNQLSKATLLLAVEQLVQLFDHVSYFPSYEIVMDELRDYRFYDEDMIHLNSTAVNYIWSRFINTFLDDETLVQMKKIKKIISAAGHRPFNPHSESHQKFLANTYRKMEDLENQIPNLSFDLERRTIQKNLL
nr:GSCFA domain-containing protein [uncultured Marinifilum sp.]